VVDYKMRGRGMCQWQSGTKCCTKVQLDGGIDTMSGGGHW